MFPSLYKGEYEGKRLEEKDSVCDRQDAGCVNVLLKGVSLGLRLLNKTMLKNSTSCEAGYSHCAQDTIVIIALIMWITQFL